MPRFLIFIALLVTPLLANAQSITPRDGWMVFPTKYSYNQLVKRTRSAISKAPIAIVTQASATVGAKSQGIKIPGNIVIGVYRNDYARRMLNASVAAGIEAPIRLYITENKDKSATLSYKTASFVFAPYMNEGGQKLRDLAKQLDGVLLKIAQKAAPAG
ncbi:MAG: DUF302 domain-containing protein [Rhodobacterales bacterium]